YLNLYKQACAVSDVQAEIDEELIRSIFIGRDILEIESSEITTEEKTLVTNALSKAIESLLESRAEEGVKLTEDILHRLSLLEKLFSSTAALAENNAELQKQKLLDRVSKLANLGELEPGRLETEVAFLADKLDITEELVRGKSHLAKFREIVSQPPHGKKLDFILQEIGRELNTIASKAQNSEIQSLIVEAKGECERIKEQIQNIE
ncbi:MAG: DUF1732 domain-containing protein, partial [Bdellovibrionales bacterium]|nr:DUF1732 domain-containing protein [Bdellovibrionales bacterium]